MKKAPPVFVQVHRYGYWRVFVALIAAVAAGSLTAWVVQRAGWGSGLLWALPWGIALAAGGAVWRFSWREPLSLQWDGRAWSVGCPMATVTGAPRPGTMHLAMDLGLWMLVRFDGLLPRSSTTWIPIQRRGLEPSWHALRCALHSAAAHADQVSLTVAPSTE